MTDPGLYRKQADGTWAVLGDNATQPPLATLTHGDQITRSKVGPNRLLGTMLYDSMLGVQKLPVGFDYWRIDASNRLAPDQPYVYNNNPANKGGVIPAGGLTIDGIFYPAGTHVVQFMDLSAGSVYATTAPSHLFRGCKWRTARAAPGFINATAEFTGSLALHYCDMGGTGASDAEYNEVIFKMLNGSGGRALRNYLSFTTTAVQLDLVSGAEVIENFIEDITFYYGETGPPNEGPKHLNGVTFNGGETCALVLRNKVLIQSPDKAGRATPQTDCISFFQDFGAFTGTGTNRDGSSGYRVENNFVGGGAYCIYAGQNNGSSATSVQNMRVTGNRFTSQWWPNGGSNGPLAATPQWGTLGNVESDNKWVNGVHAGLTVVGTPTAPTGVTATTNGTGSVTLSWVDGQPGYTAIETYGVVPFINGVEQAGASYTVTETTAVNGRRQVNKSATSGTRYTYQVYAVNSEGRSLRSAASNEVVAL